MSRAGRARWVRCSCPRGGGGARTNCRARASNNHPRLRQRPHSPSPIRPHRRLPVTLLGVDYWQSLYRTKWSWLIPCKPPHVHWKAWLLELEAKAQRSPSVCGSLVLCGGAEEVRPWPEPNGRAEPTASPRPSTLNPQPNPPLPNQAAQPDDQRDRAPRPAHTPPVRLRAARDNTPERVGSLRTSGPKRRTRGGAQEGTTGRTRTRTRTSGRTWGP